MHYNIVPAIALLLLLGSITWLMCNKKKLLGGGHRTIIPVAYIQSLLLELWRFGSPASQLARAYALGTQS